MSTLIDAIDAEKGGIYPSYNQKKEDIGKNEEFVCGHFMETVWLQQIVHRHNEGGEVQSCRKTIQH